MLISYGERIFQKQYKKYNNTVTTSPLEGEGWDEGLKY